MALTLPYPNMSFVPLDVLTAEEMNHIVANYTAIANVFPIGSSEIADNAITNNKIADNTITAGKIAQNTYSSSDAQIVGTWTNGKPIYRRVYAGTISSGGDASGKVIGTIPDNIDDVMKVQVISYTGSSDRFATPNTWWSETIRLLVQVDRTNGEVKEYSGSAFGNSSIKVIVEYTVSTEAKRSVPEEPSEREQAKQEEK